MIFSLQGDSRSYDVGVTGPDGVFKRIGTLSVSVPALEQKMNLPVFGGRTFNVTVRRLNEDGSVDIQNTADVYVPSVVCSLCLPCCVTDN